MAGTDDSDAGGFECENLELVPNQPIVSRWRFVGPKRTDDPTFDSLLTITPTEAPGDATARTLVHEKLAALRAAMPHAAESVRPGWNMVFYKLTAALDEFWAPSRD